MNRRFSYEKEINYDDTFPVSYTHLQKIDAVDIYIEVRSRTVLRLMEVSVAYDLMIRCVLCIGIYICLVAGQLLALYGEGGSIKYMQIAGLDLGLCLVDGFLCSLCHCASQGAQLYRTGCQSSCPVSVDGLSVCYAVDSCLLYTSRCV